MPVKNLHDEPFDETTIAKLEIFEDYAEAWMPTFVISKAPVICIIDFFAGTGYDKKGVEGSPIRLLKKIKQFIEWIFKNNTKIKVYFNEWEPNKIKQGKFELLQQACSRFLDENPEVKRVIELKVLNEDSETLFPKLYDEIKKYPSLVFLDQNGIKFLSEKYFLALEQTDQTDFLYFVSASYFWRFGGQEAFKIHLDIDMEQAKKSPYRFIHRSLLEQLRKKLPENTALRLHPFSLKKGKNIHGIIFGASHPLAVDKFLRIAWNRNEINGEANFDIDEDNKKIQFDIFGQIPLKKIESFQKMVKEKIVSSEITNNKELLDFCYTQGHIGSHAATVVRELKKSGILLYQGTSPLVTYDNVYKNGKMINYKLK